VKHLLVPAQTSYTAARNQTETRHGDLIYTHWVQK